MPRTPVYRKIIQDVRRAIARGDLKPGDRLRTIDQLAADYNCSITPVKYALRIMDEAGIIETRQGIGSYVAKPPEDSDDHD